MRKSEGGIPGSEEIRIRSVPILRLCVPLSCVADCAGSDVRADWFKVNIRKVCVIPEFLGTYD